MDSSPFRPQFPVIMAGYPTLGILVFRTNPYGSEACHPHENCKFRDRIDLHVEVPLVDFHELSSNAATGGKSETIRARVVRAGRIQSGMTCSAINKCGIAKRARRTQNGCRVHYE